MAEQASEDQAATNPSISSFTNKKITIKLEETNYLIWKQQVLLMVKQHRLRSFLDGTATIPSEKIKNAAGVEIENPDFATYEALDSALASWLLSSVSQSILPELVGLESASKIWMKINRLYSNKSASKILYYKNLLTNQQKRELSMRDYLATIKSHCDHLAMLGEPVPESAHISHILNGLTFEYEPIIAIVNAKINQFDLDTVHTLLIDSEARQKSFLQNSIAHANYAARLPWQSIDDNSIQIYQTQVPYSSHRDRNPYHQAIPPYLAQNNAGRGFPRPHLPGNFAGHSRGRGRSFFRPTCQLCHRIGHTADRCYYRNEYQIPLSSSNTSNVANAFLAGNCYSDYTTTGHSDVFVDNDQYFGNYFENTSVAHNGGYESVPISTASSQSMTGIVQNTQPIQSQKASDSTAAQAFIATPEIITDDGWYADSGATHHVANSSIHLQNPIVEGKGKVMVGNGSGLDISLIGNVCLNSLNSQLNMNKVLCVPDMKKNLLSVAQFTKENGVSIEFFPHACFVKDLRTRKIVMDGVEVNRMYKMRAAPTNKIHPSSAQCFNLSKSDSLDLWHKRLGHPAYDTVKHILKNASISFSSIKPVVVCSACQYGKAHKLSFSNSTTVYSRPLELIAIDLWGPAPVLSHGHSYYMACVDAFSRFTWIFPLQKKSDVLIKFREFKLLVENKFATKICAIQTDNGGEFLSSVFKSFIINSGIEHRYTCPHTSEQNGLVERRHRLIVEMGLTLLAQASLPIFYWADAFCTSVFLINRLSSSILGGSTPFEKLYGTKPDYSILKVFGCECYPLVRPYNKHKLQYRSTRCIFLGYSSQHKGYNCLDLTSGRVYVSRHVIFNEEVFPKISSENIQKLAVNNGADHKFSSLKLKKLPSQTTITTQITPSPSPTSSATTSPSQTPPVTPISTQDSPLPINSSSTSPSQNSPPTSNTNQPTSQPDPSVTPSASAAVETFTLPTLDIVPYNSHPMITRSKDGIFKPKVFLAVDDVSVPSTIDQALAVSHWKQAAEEEYQALLKFGTWSLVPLPPGRKTIGCKWLFKVKTQADGTPIKYKGRLVAKGYVQEAGIDYNDTFSPVIKAVTVRIVLTIAVTNNWKLHQVDFNNAFLNGVLSEEVYMTQPPGFEQFTKSGQPLVCLLHKALYGLKQAPRAWFKKLADTLMSLGFSESKSDSCLFIYKTDDNIVYLLAYVDDLIITGDSEKVVKKLIDQMRAIFSLKDLGDLSFFLGVEFTKTPAGLLLTQKKYITQLLEKTNLLLDTPYATPMAANIQPQAGDSALYSDPTLYRSVLGTLQYVCYTRPDISFSVNKLSQYMHEPTIKQWTYVERLLRYLRGTISHGLLIKPAPQLRLQAFADADWGGNRPDRKSTSGFCTYLGPNPITWTSRKQQVVARNATDAEYRSVADAVADVLWIIALLKEMYIDIVDTPNIWCDNSGAVALAANPVLHNKSKHVEIDLHFVREKVAAGIVQVGFVPSFDQVADIFTKAQSRPLFNYCRKRLNIESFETPRFVADEVIFEED